MSTKLAFRTVLMYHPEQILDWMGKPSCKGGKVQAGPVLTWPILRLSVRVVLEPQVLDSQAPICMMMVCASAKTHGPRQRKHAAAIRAAAESESYYHVQAGGFYPEQPEMQ